MKLCLICHNHFPDEQDRCPQDNAQLVPLGQDPFVGMIIQNKYKLESVIGKGSMGTVYKATQELIERDVAVKILHSHLAADNESLKRFHQQAKAASRLHHPHIITLYDYGILPSNQPFLVMDLITGITLAQLLEECINLSLPETQAIFKQICEALADAHRHGVIHRDLKPDNIVLEESNNQKHWVKVVDFGIAKLVQGSEGTLAKITLTGTVCGSPTYMSPEQFHGSDVDQRSDIYSLGAVLFETLTGHVPFSAYDLVSLMAQHLAEKPPSLKSVRPDLEFSPALEDMVQRALAKDPRDRPLSMKDFWDELEATGNDTKKTISSLSNSPPDILPTPTMESPLTSQNALVIEGNNQKLATPVLAIDEIRHEHSAAQAQIEPPLGGKRPKSRAKVPLWLSIFGFIQVIIPYITLAVLAGALLSILLKDKQATSVLDTDVSPFLRTLTGKKVVEPNPQALVKQGKLFLAKSVLEKRASARKLDDAERDLLDQIYIRLAAQDAKSKRLKSAIHLLEKVSNKGKEASRAKTLKKKYQKMLGQ